MYSRVLQLIPYTLVDTTGYVTDPLFSFVFSNSSLFFSQVEAQGLRYNWTCLLTLTFTGLSLPHVQLKQTFLLRKDFCRSFVSASNLRYKGLWPSLLQIIKTAPLILLYKLLSSEKSESTFFKIFDVFFS